jgi:hypothetical protein
MYLSLEVRGEVAPILSSLNDGQTLITSTDVCYDILGY